MLTVVQTAKVLGVSGQTVYSLIWAGELEAIRAGVRKGIRIAPESIAAFLERRKIKKETPKPPPKVRLRHIHG